MNNLIKNCQKLLEAYETGQLGQTVMPEDSNPKHFGSKEERLCYFTLPMALNYQRNSYKLWEAALKTHKNSKTRLVFDIAQASKMNDEDLRVILLKYKLALQPNKHIKTWQTISKTILENWGSLKQLIVDADNDFLRLQQIVQKKHKKGFPYLSGPKIFNYWSFILTEYGKIKLKNAEYIEIAPDTHVIKCSIKLGLISGIEAEKITREELSGRWRRALSGSGINPIVMHPPLWFWSRNGFKYKL